MFIAALLTAADSQGMEAQMHLTAQAVVAVAVQAVAQVAVALLMDLT